MKRFILASLLMFFALNLQAQRTKDIAGSKDFPLVSRFDGSIIQWYQHKNFDRYFMLSLKDHKLDKYEIDGAVTRIQYAVSKEHSVFEIFKSYEAALKNNGFKILLELDKTNCGVNLSEQLYNGEFNGLNALSDKKSLSTNYREGEFTYLSAKKKVNGKDVYIVVYIANWDYPLITFDAIEVKALDNALVTVKDLESNINEDGHIAIHHIYFDTGKFVIKPESKEVLNNIATYLKTHSDKKYLIVGHTDNVGDFEANLTLSLQRAKAVVDYLVGNYGIDGAQLKAYGDGQTAPIASNTTEKGRAKNRRVEIVAQ